MTQQSPMVAKKQKIVQRIYQLDIFNRPGFCEAGNLGSHSVRKFGSTFCRKKGTSKDEKDLRGWWKIRT